jgi:hypothetical protein
MTEVTDVCNIMYRTAGMHHTPNSMIMHVLSPRGTRRPLRVMPIQGIPMQGGSAGDHLEQREGWADTAPGGVLYLLLAAGTRAVPFGGAGQLPVGERRLLGDHACPEGAAAEHHPQRQRHSSAASSLPMRHVCLPLGLWHLGGSKSRQLYHPQTGSR